VSIWSDKQADAREWQVEESDATVRSSLAGAGTGDVATMVADSGGPVSGGTVGGITATVASPSNRATLFTLVLAPGDGTAPAPTPENQAPEAQFASTCSELVCSFDGTASNDPDGGIVSYAWAFGDGGTGAGEQVEHTYGAAGSYEVTLTVTDDEGATARTTATVTVAVVPEGNEIGLRGSAGMAARSMTAPSVDVPESVEAGDALLLMLTTNSTVSGTSPAGWTLAHVEQNAPGITTQLFTRVAGPSDAGASVAVALSGQATVTLQLLAYSGTDPDAPVASVTGAGAEGGTAHTTPTATAPAGSWVVSMWSDKQPVARAWTPPADVAERANLAGLGKGDIATLVVDSGGPVSGAVGGLTATVPTESGRVTMLTIVLAGG
jgi:PKD repeat protein